MVHRVEINKRDLIERVPFEDRITDAEKNQLVMMGFWRGLIAVPGALLVYLMIFGV